MTLLVGSQLGGHMEMVDLLLKSIADVDAVNQGGRTALMVATTHNRIQATIALLERGADSSRCSYTNKTALDIAREFGHVGVIQELQAHEQEMNTSKLVLLRRWLER